jgi:hypothetical protein
MSAWCGATVDDDLPTLKCQLRELTLSLCLHLTSAWNGLGISKFIDLFSPSLVKLTIQGISSFELDLGRFKKLEAITLSNSFKNHATIIGNSLTFKTLVINAVGFLHTVEFCDFLASFTSLTHLKTDKINLLSEQSIDVATFQLATKQMKSVTSLTNTGSFTILQQAAFENLQTLTLNFCCDEQIDWKGIINNNPSLQMVHINVLSIKKSVNYNYEELIASARASMTIKITNSFKINKRQLQILKENLPQECRLCWKMVETVA